MYYLLFIPILSPILTMVSKLLLVFLIKSSSILISFTNKTIVEAPNLKYPFYSTFLKAFLL